MDDAALGHQLRARRAATGRTVAAVAADAGLSVPYIANLENGRGNPTMTALSRLAEALGMRLSVTLVPEDEERPAGEHPPAGVPASLVRFSRAAGFRRAAGSIAEALDLAEDEMSARLLTAMSALAHATGRDLSQADWSRVIDALLLVTVHPTQ